VSSQAAGHLTLVPDLIAQLRAQGAPEVLVVVGGVIPPQDYPLLQQAGAACVFGPGTPILDAAAAMLDRLEGRAGTTRP
jgi:methylmalonyl-CoA mutase